MSEAKLSQTVVVANPHGLHLRPLEQIARCAAQFRAKIEIINENVRADATSVLSLLALGAPQGAILKVEATGADAEAALAAVVALVEEASDTEPNTGS